VGISRQNIPAQRTVKALGLSRRIRESREREKDLENDSFTFQRYYFEAISTLKSKEKLELYDAICAYKLHKYG
jgi:hypothetical protein